MNKIQKVSTYIIFTLNFLLISLPLLSIFKWIFIQTKTNDIPDLINFFGIFEKTIQTPEGYINLSNVSWTPLLKLLGFSADIIGLLPFLIIIYILKIIFKNYQKGDIFNIRNAILCQRLGIVFLVDAILIKTLSQTLMILAITLSNPPGHRYLTISFGIPNLADLFFSILLIVASWVMLEASKLHDEQQFTI